MSAFVRTIDMPASHVLWIALVVSNLVVQTLCFFSDGSRPLHWAKKVTTPLLLFSAFLILRYHSGTAFSVASIILLAMAIGELGMEGSSVVASRSATPSALERWAVTLAGLLFLLVNVFLGTVLLVQVSALVPIGIGFGAAAGLIATMLAGVFRVFEPDKTVRTQMLLYASGLVVLAAGALAALVGGPISHLGVAAIILTVSDSLVLIRLGAGFDKTTPGGKRNLLVLMIVILFLYYVYMGVLISSGSPFILER